MNAYFPIGDVTKNDENGIFGYCYFAPLESGSLATNEKCVIAVIADGIEHFIKLADLKCESTDNPKVQKLACGFRIPKPDLPKYLNYLEIQEKTTSTVIWRHTIKNNYHDRTESRIGLLEQDISALIKSKFGGKIRKSLAISEFLYREDETKGRCIKELTLQLLEARSNASSNIDKKGNEPKRNWHWPATNSTESKKSSDPYDRRVDDSVLNVVIESNDFLSRYDFSDAADFGRAIDDIGMRRESNQTVEEPYVSIIIPVFNQVSYTLNCLAGLIPHESIYKFEIILIDDCSTDFTKQIREVNSVRYIRQKENSGFISSCNLGARYARGEIIVFLNNDTRPAVGWLDNLIKPFTSSRNIGVVGSKLYSEDGLLQECGGIVWRDGAAWNYGRDDDPNRPEYCYARMADYVSGCALAIKKSLFRKLKGFDSFYSPAYYEDTDLCMKVWESGLEVWVQPQSRIVHFEGKTSGTDTFGDGVKRFQRLNHRKFIARWRSKLISHRRYGENLESEKERRVQQRVLVIDATTPTPQHDAGSVQTVMAIRALQTLGCKVSFIPYDNWLYQPEHTDRLLEMGVECAYAPYESNLEPYLARRTVDFDFILIFRVTIYSRCIDLIRRMLPSTPIIFHLADLHYLRMLRAANVSGSAEEFAASEHMKSRELACIVNADAVITHSDVESRIITEMGLDVPISVCPYLVDPPQHRTRVVKNSKDRQLVFVGGFRHQPNVDAVEWLISDILPHVLKIDPDVIVNIVGDDPFNALESLRSENVRVLGWQPNLSEILCRCQLMIAPMRYGAGVKGKLYSAVLAQIPVVTTSIGAEGTGFKHDQHVIVADDSIEFSKQIIELLVDRRRAKLMASRALKFVSENNSLERGVGIFSNAIKAAFDHRQFRDFL